MITWLRHVRRTARAYRRFYTQISREHGHPHRCGALVCGWCLDEIPTWARVLVAEQEAAR